MTTKHIGTKQIDAWPEERIDDPGYHVVYSKDTDDEYHSWSPKHVFEEAYECAAPGVFEMSYGHALECLKGGHSVARSGWNGKGMWLQLQVPDEHSKMTLPYIYINYPNDAVNTPGARCPWLASQTDMLANDWGIVG